MPQAEIKIINAIQILEKKQATKEVNNDASRKLSRRRPKQLNLNQTNLSLRVMMIRRRRLMPKRKARMIRRKTIKLLLKRRMKMPPPRKQKKAHQLPRRQRRKTPKIRLMLRN